MNTALDNSNSKFSRIKEEFQRVFSIFMYNIEEPDDEFDTIKSHTKNKDDLEIIKELEKSTKKLEQNAIDFSNGVGTISKPKKEKTSNGKNEDININIKPTNIRSELTDKKSKDIER